MVAAESGRVRQRAAECGRALTAHSVHTAQSQRARTRVGVVVPPKNITEISQKKRRKKFKKQKKVTVLYKKPGKKSSIDQP